MAFKAHFLLDKITTFDARIQQKLKDFGLLVPPSRTEDPHRIPIYPNNLTKEQIQEYARIQKDSPYFSEKFFTVNNEPYSLEKSPYAKAIYEDESEFIVLFLARSLTKSTILSGC